MFIRALTAGLVAAVAVLAAAPAHTAAILKHRVNEPCHHHLGADEPRRPFECRTTEPQMRRHQMLMLSLGMFTAGILCQAYNVFNPDEPYMQQLSFMFVAMPSALAIIHHYYHNEPYHPPPAASDTPPQEERQHNQRDTRSGASDGQVLNRTKKTTHSHVADTSSDTLADATPCFLLSQLDKRKASTFVGAESLSEYDDDDSWPLSDGQSKH
jgi:hypothetical protein